MPPIKAAAPAHRVDGGGRQIEQLGRQLDLHNIERSPRRQYLARHLTDCGPRPVLEALLAVRRGYQLDAVLEGFGRLPVDLFRALGADALPIDRLCVIAGAST